MTHEDRFHRVSLARLSLVSEHNRPLLKRLNDLIKDAQREPFRGLGKPEPLKGELTGYWSRRINAEHRLVYSVSATELTIIACRFHYKR